MIIFSSLQMSASDVFKAMFMSGMKETQAKSVDMREYSDVALEQMLEFMYTLEITQTLTMLPYFVELWALGDKYYVYGLQEHVSRVQRKHITLGNVINVYAEADTFSVQPIKYFCLDIIGGKRLTNYLRTC